jgi:hypothetical protein
MRSRRPSRVWRRVKRLLGLGRGSDPPPPDWPDEEPALVPLGPPRRPRPAGAVELELPEEPEDLDLDGRQTG